jgi:hypothetical protein
LLYANSFAFQLLQAVASQTIFAGNQENRAAVNLIAEGNLLFAFFGDVHTREDGIEFTCLQGGNNPVEIVLNPDALRLQLGANRVAQIDIKTDNLALRIFRFKRGESGVNAKTQLFNLTRKNGRRSQQCYQR